MRNDGRPALYTKDELMDILIEYQKNHPNKKITYSDLERETDIKRHIWKYQMKDVIEARNNKQLKSNIPDNTGFQLPSVDEIMKNCDNDMEEIKNYLIVFTDMIYDLYRYKENKNTIDSIKCEYEEKIHFLELQIEQLEKIIDNQQDVLNRYILSSASKEKREQEGIKDNIIQLDAESLKRYDEMFEALMK